MEESGCSRRSMEIGSTTLRLGELPMERFRPLTKISCTTQTKYQSSGFSERRKISLRLPAVDAAMPLLGLFGRVVGRKRDRYKIALLKTLQEDGSGRRKIRRPQEIVHWLEPASVTNIVTELRGADVLVYEPVTGLYRLTPAARVMTALLDAMTIPEVHPRGLTRTPRSYSIRGRTTRP